MEQNKRRILMEQRRTILFIDGKKKPVEKSFNSKNASDRFWLGNITRATLKNEPVLTPTSNQFHGEKQSLLL